MRRRRTQHSAYDDPSRGEFRLAMAGYRLSGSCRDPFRRVRLQVNRWVLRLRGDNSPDASEPNDYFPCFAQYLPYLVEGIISWSEHHEGVYCSSDLRGSDWCRGVLCTPHPTRDGRCCICNQRRPGRRSRPQSRRDELDSSAPRWNRSIPPHRSPLCRFPMTKMVASSPRQSSRPVGFHQT